MEQGTLEKTQQLSAQKLPVPKYGPEEALQVEAKVFDMAEYRNRRVGREVIKITADELGYNDALTYLYRYLEDSNVDLIPDLESEISERLKSSNHFENHVFFKPVGNDFVSLKDEVSLIQMTNKNLPMLKEQSAKNPQLVDEYERAKLESHEVMTISQWFEEAGDGEFLIFESLPLLDGEDFAVTRVYQRVGNVLEGCYFSLNNPSPFLFNMLRKEFGVDADCQTALEFLGKPYKINNLKIASTADLVDYYVKTYDNLLKNQNQKNYSFGYETSEGSQNQNSLEMVKSQKKLLSVFTNAVEALAESGGVVTLEISKLCEDFQIEGLHEGQSISSRKAREILKAVSLGVVDSICKIDKKLLQDLESSDCGYDANYDTVVYGSNQASANGDTYDGLCSTIDVSSGQMAGQTGSEQIAIMRAYGITDKLKNFGKPKLGVCQIKNCPSRGKSKYVHNMTLVGGCGICVHCHQIFEKGKSPEKIYDDKIKEEQKKQKQVEEENVRVEKERVERQKRNAARKKQKLISETKKSNIPKQKSFFQKLEEIGKKAV